LEWSEPAIVLDAALFGEADARMTLLTETQGAWRGLVRGGASQRHAATWQVGNLLAARWVARLPDQLGTLSGELIHPAAAIAMTEPLALATLRAACAVTVGALPEREPHQALFIALTRLLAGITDIAHALPALVRFERDLLADLGYGLDLRCCAVTGSTDNLAFVSPRTGRAVSADAVGLWRARVLPLPAFLARDTDDSPPDWSALRDGLALTGHFLTRDAFGAHHAPLPWSRRALYEQIARLAETENA
jgi:DNA repair protein RecO (recombination protein O)